MALVELDGCLITHEHKDHSKYAKDIIKYCPIYTSGGTLSKLELGRYAYKAVVIQAHLITEIGSFMVVPFETQHDAIEPLGFVIYSKETKENLLFATDTYYIKPRFNSLDYIMVECNYSKAILQANIDKGLIPEAMAKRLWSSHFELENVKDFLRAADLTLTKKIYLLHLSDGNSNADLFKTEIMKLTGKPVEICEA